MPVLSEGFVFPGGTFFTGIATAPLDIVPAQYPVALGGRPYNIEPRLYRRGFVDTQRPAQEQEREPGEATLSPEALWRRSQSDWSLGAGQLWLDEEESVRRRFRFSLGLEVFGDRALEMLPATEEKRNSANTNLKLIRANDRLYYLDGGTVAFSDAVSSEQNATWVTNWTTATGLPGGTQLDIAFSGNHVYVLGSDNSIYRATVGTTSFAGPFYNPTAVLTKIYAGLGRLFGSVNNQLYEITMTPGETLIFTHPDPTYTFSSLCAAPTGIYFAGNVGTLGEVRHTWVRDDGTAFVAPVVAAEFINEPVNTCEAAGSVMLIGTNSGLRMATIDGIATGLNFGPAITTVGAVRDIVFDAVEAETFGWFTWTNILSGVSGLGKVRISRQTETLVPAYATDIYTTTSASITSVASIRSRRYFAATSDGFFGATANKVPTATLLTGRIRYGLLSPKIFATLQWRTEALEGSVAASAVVDGGGSIPITSQATAGSLGVDPTRLTSAAQGEYIEITFTFTRDAGDITQGPVFRWWVMRSLHAVDGTERFLVPLILEQKTQTPLGPVKAVDVREEVDFISQLVKARQVVKYQEGLSSYDVYVVNIEQRPEQWAEMEHGVEGILMVELQTVN